jgi:hypothetical protein
MKDKEWSKTEGDNSVNNRQSTVIKSLSSRAQSRDLLIQSSAMGGFHILTPEFSLLATLKMQNKPISKSRHNGASRLSTTDYCSLITADCPKNKPNSNPFDSMATRRTSEIYNYKKLKTEDWRLRTNFGFILETIVAFLDNFGAIKAQFGVVWDYFGNTI